MFAFVFLIPLSFYLILNLINPDTTINVKLENGEIRGRIAHSPNLHNRFYAFQQIPYAAPPIGNLRFKSPQPVSNWNSVLDATKSTKICYQVRNDVPNESEDCLYLNVYTPLLPKPITKARRAPLPVMVYFHGGAFVVGDALYTTLGADYFMNFDVVVVTVNYRLGAFGFISTQDSVLPGNNGLKDQLFALKWVQANIHVFGGDPKKVTIFGQSAGASSVAYQLINPKTKGLYRAAIMESATALCPFGYQREARKYAYKTAAYINENITEEWNSQELFNFLMTVPANAIRNATDQLSAELETVFHIQLSQGYFYAPVIEQESDEAVLTEKMFKVIETGRSNPVPIIIGINSEESIGPTTDANFMQKIMKVYDNYTSALVPNDMNVLDEIKKTEAGNRVRSLYVDDNLLQNHLGPSIRYLSDTQFNRPVIKHASLQSMYSDVYFYQFSFDGKMFNNTVTVEGAEKVGHNEEMAYLWRITTPLIDNYDLTKYDSRDFEAQKRLLTLWTNFAKYLNPTPNPDGNLQNVEWSKFSSDTNFAYLDIGDDLVIKNNPKEETFGGWNEIYDEFGNGDYDTY